MNGTAIARVSLLIALATIVAAPLAGQEPDRSAQARMGAYTFREYCRSCHGLEGKGDGPVAEHLNPRPADLTGIRERNRGEFPFDDVYAAVAMGKRVKGHGNSEMPVWGNAFRNVRGGQSEEEVKVRITQLVHFLASIQTGAETQ